MATENPIYLDNNATTRVDPRVADLVMHYMRQEFGNAGSRTHIYGSVAQKAVALARKQLAETVEAKPNDVLFTSGATESNNIAILGLAEFGNARSKRHIISTGIEHKAVLEPLQHLRNQGYEVDLLDPGPGGRVSVESIADRIRKDTLLVSVMHVNNETGIAQPIAEIADLLRETPAYFHVDAAQSFGKINTPLAHDRIDMLSISGHKFYAPKGIGALIMRRRGNDLPPLAPIHFGGGQERGLRPGTLNVPLIAGIGLAAQLCVDEYELRRQGYLRFQDSLFGFLDSIQGQFLGEVNHLSSNCLACSIGNLDSEALFLLLHEHLAFSNGSACTSSRIESSHVLQSMKIRESELDKYVRFSWSYETELPEWPMIKSLLNTYV